HDGPGGDRRPPGGRDNPPDGRWTKGESVPIRTRPKFPPPLRGRGSGGKHFGAPRDRRYGGRRRGRGPADLRRRPGPGRTGGEGVRPAPARRRAVTDRRGVPVAGAPP